MNKVNLVIVYNKELNKVLMCLRKKNPYIGLFNFVGGKLENNEDSFDAAYRELQEETGINKEDINLIHLMDFTYHYDYDFRYDKCNTIIEIFCGVLNHDVSLVEEINELHWIDVESDFYDKKKYAGEGNIQHMIYHSLDYLRSNV